MNGQIFSNAVGVVAALCSMTSFIRHSGFKARLGLQR